jgi:hypothetical protein
VGKGLHFLYTFDHIAELSELNAAVGRNSDIYLSSKRAYDNLMLLKNPLISGALTLRGRGGGL